jgi:hypothetical protein
MPAVEALELDPQHVQCLTQILSSSACSPGEFESVMLGETSVCLFADQFATCPGNGEGAQADCKTRYDSGHCEVEGQIDSCIKFEYTMGPPFNPEGSFQFNHELFTDILRVTVDTRTIDDWNEYTHLELI